jgi:hypothetical protein
MAPEENGDPDRLLVQEIKEAVQVRPDTFSHCILVRVCQKAAPPNLTAGRQCLPRAFLQRDPMRELEFHHRHARPRPEEDRGCGYRERMDVDGIPVVRRRIAVGSAAEAQGNPKECRIT